MTKKFNYHRLVESVMLPDRSEYYSKIQDIYMNFNQMSKMMNKEDGSLRPFRCHFCPKTFKRKGHLHTHL